MKGIIGKKLGMTHVYDDDGTRIPVTVVEAGPCPVLAVRNEQRDGYHALQLGFGRKQAKNVSNPVRGHLRAAGLSDAPPAIIREIRLDDAPDVEVGDSVKADAFETGEFVDVAGQTKGRGFQGVVKRWRFGGGSAGHGAGWSRKPGSIGMCVNPGHVYKGRKMPGHMGNVRRTVQNLRIVAVRPEENLLLVKGAVPGPRGGTVMVRSAIKK